MAVLITTLYIAIGIGFLLTSDAKRTFRQDHSMIFTMSFSMAWGLGIGSVMVFWFPTFFQGAHTGMYIGALAGMLSGWRYGIPQMLNGMLSGLMGGMMGAMLLFMVPPHLHVASALWLSLFNGVVFLLLVLAGRQPS